MKTAASAVVCLGVVILAAGPVWATETENLGIRALPAKNVKIDGKINDWDLTGGVFVCGDAETLRDQYGVWFHLMYDDDKLYVLSRWIDPTPLNNPGQVVGSYGFAGDCLQFRVIFGPKGADRTSHWECWKDRTGKTKIGIAYGRKFNKGGVGYASKQGASQAFRVNADGKGYAQEIAIPWKLLTPDGGPVKSGEKFIVTVEPNFTVGAGGRMTIKGIFKKGIAPDRVFTFMANGQWGPAYALAQGNVDPQPVRLSDAREFAVRMEKGLPVVNWTGLILSKELRGFKTIKFAMPGDGYVSMHIKNAAGVVVRQLLNCAFYAKGDQEVKWDGLTTATPAVPLDKPGNPVSPGRYTVRAIWHKGIGLRLRGFASNAGSAPWDNGPQTNWGGDHGVPSDVATDGKLMYLGWTGAEAGKALVATDFKANVKWKNSRKNMAGSPLVAAADGVVYGMNGTYVYALKSGDGAYVEWAADGSPDLLMKDAFTGARPRRPSGVAAGNGRLYVSAKAQGLVSVLDAKSRKILRVCEVPGPGRLCAAGKKLVYVVSGGTSVVALDPTTGETRTVIKGLRNASGVTVDKAGLIYVGVRAPDNQVKVFSATGKPIKAIGTKGGRPPLGPWQPDGMLNISGIAVDPEGQLWVAEATGSPKRFSVWDTKTGELVKELFGPTHYGASGGAISAKNPNVMVGEGCEWSIDPKTGRGKCTGVIEQRTRGFARFCYGSGGREYIAFIGSGPLAVYERLGPGKYALRAAVKFGGNVTSFWSDRNGDGKEQRNEIATVNKRLGLGGYGGGTPNPWSMNMNSDFTLYASVGRGAGLQIKVNGFTACNAPKWDLANMKSLPRVYGALSSLDNKLVVSCDQGLIRCYEVASGKLRWAYPNSWHGVHGSHKAPSPEAGVLRGAFGFVGTAHLPGPLGDIWALNSNVGEWFVLTGDGFYLSRLFQADPIKVNFPDEALPGEILDNCPPGLGGEDFGGSLTQGKDGKVYIQAGKTGLWNVEVVGLENVKRLRVETASVAIAAADVPKARAMRAEYLRGPVIVNRLVIKKMTPKFTGDLKADFRGAKAVTYKKQAAAAVTTAAAWDARNLYLAWDVKDRTPWINAAEAAEEMYVSGDTVDFQIGTDPKANAKRDKAVLGDLRLSIGNFRGKATAVIFRKVSREKRPKTFSSGVIREYRMDYVAVVAGARIKVTRRIGKGYVVEAAIPLSALGLRPSGGLKLRGDVGVTHAGPGGQRTRLRTYWSNQKTGIVDDAVFELMMEPRNWGELTFQE